MIGGVVFISKTVLFWLFKTTLITTIIYLLIKSLQKVLQNEVSISWQYCLTAIIFIRLFLPSISLFHNNSYSSYHLDNIITSLTSRFDNSKEDKNKTLSFSDLPNYQVRPLSPKPVLELPKENLAKEKSIILININKGISKSTVATPRKSSSSYLYLPIHCMVIRVYNHSCSTYY